MYWQSDSPYHIYREILPPPLKMELIKLFTHACTVDGLMELAGSMDYIYTLFI